MSWKKTLKLSIYTVNTLTGEKILKEETMTSPDSFFDQSCFVSLFEYKGKTKR